MDRRVAIALAAVLLLLVGVFVSAAAYEAGRGAWDGGFEDRPMHRDSALLAAGITRDGQSPMDSNITARFTLFSGDDKVASRTNRPPQPAHFEVPDGTYVLRVESAEATGEIEIDLDRMTHLLAIVHDDGTMSFRVDDSHHGPPHRPFQHHPPDGHRMSGPGGRDGPGHDGTSA